MSATVTILVGFTIEDPEKVIETAREGFRTRYGATFDPEEGRELELAVAFLVAVDINAPGSLCAFKGVTTFEPHAKR